MGGLEEIFGAEGGADFFAGVQGEAGRGGVAGFAFQPRQRDGGEGG